MLGEGHHGLPIIDAAGHRCHPVGAVGGGDRERLVPTAGGVDLGGDVLPGDRRAIGPGGLRIDGVGDHLRVGCGQLHIREVVVVDLHRPVGGDDERPRHGGPQHACGVGLISVEVEGVEVRRHRADGQSQIPALSQGGRVLRVGIAGRSEFGVTTRRRRGLLAGRTARDHQCRRHSHREQTQTRPRAPY